MNVVTIRSRNTVHRYARDFFLGQLGVWVIWHREDRTNRYVRTHIGAFAAVHQLNHPLGGIAFMQRLLNLKQGPARAHSELKRPGIALFVDNAVNIHIADVIKLVQRVGYRVQHFISQLGLLRVAQYCSLLPRGHAKVAVHQLFEFPVFQYLGAEPRRPEPAPDSHLDTGYEFLEHEVRFQLV